jgi:hypothetical protein
VLLFDSWYLAEEFIACLLSLQERLDQHPQKEPHCNLETNSFVLKDVDEKRIPLVLQRKVTGKMPK